MRGLLDGLETDPTEQQILAFIKKKIKGGADAVEKEKIISELETKKILGRRALNAIWKAAARELAKPKGIGKLNMDIDDDFHTRIEYTRKRIIYVNEQNPFLFQRGGAHVAVDRDEEGRALIETLSFKGYKQRLNAISRWQKVTYSGDTQIEREVSIPEDSTEYLYHGPRDYLPPLNRLATVPTFTKGKKLTAPGYQQGVFYDPLPGFEMPPVPEHPDAKTVSDCVNDLGDLFADFSLSGLTREEFMADLKAGKPVADFAHLMSYMLSSVARDMIAGPCPLHLARKGVPRSGGTLMMTTAERIATCQPSAPQTLPTREDETKKMIFSTFLGGAAYALLDNIRGGKETESDTLAAAITSYPKYQDRMLGQSKMVTVPATTVIGGTGNRTALSTQLAERTLMIEVAPHVENPGDRPPSTFKYNLTKEIEDRGTHYLWCLLVLVKNWISQGCKEWKGTPLGGFERHAAVVGGILDAAGIEGFMGNRQKLAELVKSDDPAEAFMDALIDAHKSTPNTAFKAGGVADATSGKHVLAFREVLEDAQIPMNNFGYKTTADGEIIYPEAADRKIAQRIRNLIGTVREHDEIRYTLTKVEGTARNSAMLYQITESKIENADEVAAKAKRKERRNRVKF